MEDIRKERYRQRVEDNYSKFEEITQNDLYEKMEKFLDNFNNESRYYVLKEITKTRIALTNMENSIKKIYFKN